MRQARVLGVLACLAVLAGCGDDSTEPPAEPPAGHSLDIAPVPADLDLGKVDDACGLLDQAQRDELGLPVVKARSTRMCDLGTEDDPARLTVSFDLPALDRVVERCGEAEVSTDDCDAWTADTVEGYPVVRAPVPAGSLTLCRVYLGATGSSSILITDSQGQQGEPGCSLADETAGFILETLR